MIENFQDWLLEACEQSIEWILIGIPTYLCRLSSGHILFRTEDNKT